MNFRSAFDLKFSDGQIFSLLRIMNGMSLLVYYTVALIPNWSRFFKSGGYVLPERFVFYPSSWIFIFWEQETLKFLLFILCFILIITYTIGFYAKFSQILLIPIHIGFHLANPLIIHEPQQLTNLLLVILFLLPIDDHWSIRKGPQIFFYLDPRYRSKILKVLLLYIGVYYFFAGVKKLPDPHWISGNAVKLLASWPFLAQDNFFNQLARMDVISKIFSWFSLVFEISFVFISFSKLKYHLIYIGVLFHLGISLTLDVGLFFWAMIQWYPLLLISKSIESQDALSSR